MKTFCAILLLLFTASIGASIAALAESTTTAWPFSAEVTPQASGAGIYHFWVPLEVMGEARDDLADLRLVDANGREIPYAIRVRREVDDAREVAGRLFNQASVGSVSEASVDLGENPGEHNEVEIESSGMNFRRVVAVDGSDTGSDWKTLRAGDVIFSFASANNAARSKSVSYQTSRYRYLRVRVFSDERVDKEPPVISAVKVSMAAHEKGVPLIWDVGLPMSQYLRHDRAPASAWTIDFGARVPCDHLFVRTQDQSFSRPFQVEVVDDPQNVSVIASGELTKRVGNQDQPAGITFDQEVHARKLRLVVTDYNNPTLSITEMKASAPVRELFFEMKDAPAQPLRLFFGNLNADAPHYDFERELSAKLLKPPLSVIVASYAKNPDYQPPPSPFTERAPWLIYVVLTISSVALALILFSLARATMRNTPEQRASPET